MTVYQKGQTVSIRAKGTGLGVAGQTTRFVEIEDVAFDQEGKVKYYKVFCGVFNLKSGASVRHSAIISPDKIIKSV